MPSMIAGPGYLIWTRKIKIGNAGTFFPFFEQCIILLDKRCFLSPWTVCLWILRNAQKNTFTFVQILHCVTICRYVSRFIIIFPLLVITWLNIFTVLFLTNWNGFDLERSAEKNKVYFRKKLRLDFTHIDFTFLKNCSSINFELHVWIDIFREIKVKKKKMDWKMFFLHQPLNFMQTPNRLHQLLG